MRRRPLAKGSDRSLESPNVRCCRQGVAVARSARFLLDAFQQSWSVRQTRESEQPLCWGFRAARARRHAPHSPWSLAPHRARTSRPILLVHTPHACAADSVRGGRRALSTCARHAPSPSGAIGRGVRADAPVSVTPSAIEITNHLLS